jgi:hypothetical protein
VRPFERLAVETRAACTAQLHELVTTAKDRSEQALQEAPAQLAEALREAAALSDVLKELLDAIKAPREWHAPPPQAFEDADLGNVDAAAAAVDAKEVSVTKVDKELVPAKYETRTVGADGGGGGGAGLVGGFAGGAAAGWAVGGPVGAVIGAFCGGLFGGRSSSREVSRQVTVCTQEAFLRDVESQVAEARFAADATKVRNHVRAKCLEYCDAAEQQVAGVCAATIDATEQALQRNVADRLGNMTGTLDETAAARAVDEGAARALAARLRVVENNLRALSDAMARPAPEAVLGGLPAAAAEAARGASGKDSTSAAAAAAPVPAAPADAAAGAPEKAAADGSEFFVV